VAVAINPRPHFLNDRIPREDVDRQTYLANSNPPSLDVFRY